MPTLGTRDSQMVFTRAPQAFRDFQYNSRLDVIHRTTIGFTASATLYDTALTGAFAGFGVGDRIRVGNSPLNSREFKVATVVTGTAIIAATGSILFSIQPTADDTITINGTVVTFKASGASGNEVNIGANVAATRAALLVFLQASADTQLVKFTYAFPSTSLVLTAVTAGTAGNSLTIASSNVTNVASGATLSGGAAQVNASITVTPAFIQTEAAGANIQLERVG